MGGGVHADAFVKTVWGGRSIDAPRLPVLACNVCAY
jgi:hypothetical protein